MDLCSWRPGSRTTIACFFGATMPIRSLYCPGGCGADGPLNIQFIVSMAGARPLRRLAPASVAAVGRGWKSR